MPNNKYYFLALHQECTTMAGRIVAGGHTAAAAKRLAKAVMNLEDKGAYRWTLNDFVVSKLNLESGLVVEEQIVKRKK